MRIRVIMAAVVALLCYVSADAKTIRAERTSLSKVLEQIDRSTDSVSISFMYQQLEDYPVTDVINTDDPVKAVFKAVGFYPVKVTMANGGRIVVVEPRLVTSTKVKGRVTDENGKAIEYATVRLYTIGDSTFIGSGVTNSVGDFVIPANVTAANLTVTALGYIPVTQTVNSGKPVNVVVRANPIELNSVTVEAKYLTVDEGGKLTARPSTSQVKHSSDVYGLLGQMPLPGVYVDEIQRSITAFNEAPVILVDGIERDMNDLLAIRPSNVSRIEYITDIPAKYIERRPPVVINIVLKEPQEGGSAWGFAQSAVNTGFIDANGGTSYNQGKSEFSVSYNYSYRDYNERVINTLTSYIAPDARIDIESRGRKSPFDYNTHNGRLSYTYRFSETAFLMAKTNVSGGVRHADENADVLDSYSGNYTRHSHIRNSDISVSPDIYFQKDWKENGKLEMQAAGNISDVNYTRNLTDTLSGGAIREYPSDMKSSVRSVKFESSYARMFGKFNLNLGYRFSYSRSKNDYLLDRYVQYLRNSTNSVYGGVKASLGSVYTSFNGSVGFVNYPGEEKYSQIKTPTVNLSLYLWKQISQTVDVNLNGSFWTVRPSLTQVTDYELRYDGYLLSSGNPDLKLQKSYNVSPTVRWQANRLWCQASVNWTYNWNPIYGTIEYLGDGQFLSRPMNGDYNYELTPQVNVGFNQIFNGHLSGQVNFAYRHYKYICQDGVYTSNGPDWFFSLTGYAGEWQCQFSVSHPGRYLYGPTLMRNENHNALRISRSIGSHWRAFGGLMYFLKNEGTVYPSSTKLAHRVQEQMTSIRDNHCMVVIGISYSGSFGRIFKTGQRSLNSGAGSGDYRVVQ